MNNGHNISECKEAYKRMIPRNTKEIIDVLLIKETMTKIKNKNKILGKGHTDFLKSNEYKQKNNYVVPKAKELTMWTSIS